jgi:hypothetical protein
MNKIKTILVITSALVMTSFTAGAQEIWTEVGLSFKAVKNLTTKFDIQNRFVDVDGHYFNSKNSSEITLQYRLSPVFKLSGAYRFAYETNLIDISESEGESGKQRYCIDLNIRMPFDHKKLTLENRSRYQVSLEAKDDVNRFYRNKTTIGVEIDKNTDFSIADELYYHISKQKLDMNRLSFGLERKIYGKLYMNLLFHIETEKMGRSLGSNYILNTGLFLKL